MFWVDHGFWSVKTTLFKQYEFHKSPSQINKKMKYMNEKETDATFSDAENELVQSKKNKIDENSLLQTITIEQNDDEQQYEEQVQNEEQEDCEENEKCEKYEKFAQHYAQDLTQSECEKLTKRKTHWFAVEQTKMGEEKDNDQREIVIGADQIEDKEEIRQLINDKDGAIEAIQPRLAKSLKNANKTTTEKYAHQETGVFASRTAQRLHALFSTYKDVWICADTQQQHTHALQAYVVHAIDHILKTRDRIGRHNQLLKQGKQAEYRDQGFTRPTVLIIAPMANCAYKIINEMIRVLPERCKKSILNKQRFEELYSPDPNEPVGSFKPADFRYLFDGRDDDAFRIGISFGVNSVRLFSDFYKSDIIIASPLGLRLIIAANGELERTKEADFLSSITMMVLDQADVFSMQNWQHMELLWKMLNQLPYENHDTDFSRVREFFLSGNGQFYRQNVIISGYANVDLNNLFNNWCHNYAGRIKVCPVYSGMLSKVALHVKQVFNRINALSLTSAADDRWKHFEEYVFPNLRSGANSPFSAGHTMIFVPSYFDFVRVRNFFTAKHVNFANASEYTKKSELSRGRSNFYHGHVKYLLTTERFHFFHRYHLRGVRHIIFYGLPDNTHFYPELLNMLDLRSDSTVISLFSRYDLLNLERLLGTSRAVKLLQSSKTNHLFV